LFGFGNAISCATARAATRATPKSSLPAKLAEDAVVNLFGSLFIFDHLFMKSATATSPGYLERVSEPSSKLYPDYLAYKSGKIDQAELVRRLPHIAMIGDSLSKNFYISSPIPLALRSSPPKDACPCRITVCGCHFG
jgi:hypothetical protein